jgi:hypothetical protein
MDGSGGSPFPPEFILILTMKEQIEFKCPNCDHKVIADFDVDQYARNKVKDLIDNLQEQVRT